MKKSIALLIFLSISSLIFAQSNKSAVYFDGANDYIEVTNNKDYNVDTNSFSIQMNVLVVDTSKISSSRLYILLAKGMSSDIKNYGYSMDIRKHKGQTVFYASLGSNSVLGQVYSKSLAKPLQWFNIAATYDRQNDYLKLYINGVLEDSTNISKIGSSNNNWPLSIGRFYWPTSGKSAHYNHGNIDNFAFWNKVLSSQEIKDYVKCPPQGNEKDLFTLWNFESASGSKIVDQTKNKNDGSMFGVDWTNSSAPQNCSLDTCSFIDTTFVTHYDTTLISDTLFVNDTIYYYDTTFSYITETKYGQVNRASLSFNGKSDWVDFKNDSVFNVDKNSFTIQLSYKPKNMAAISPTKLHMLVAKGMSKSQFNTGYTIDVRMVNNKKVFYAVLGSNGTYKTVTSKTIPEDDIWYNIAAVYNRNSNYLKLYVNGIVEDSVSISGLGSSTTNWPFMIGKYYWPDTKMSSHFADGTLDNISFWNKALSSSQVNDNIMCISDGSNKDLRGLWKMESNRNSTLVDESSNAFNGLIHGAKWSNVAAPQLCATDTCQYSDTTFIIKRDTVQYHDTNYVTINDTIKHHTYDTTFIKNYDTTFVSVQDTLIFTAKLTGVAPPNNINTIKVYPNPAKSHLIVDLGNYNSMKWYTIVIKNNLGQTVFSKTIDQKQYTIDLNTWTGKGLYFLNIIDSSSNVIAVKKIGIQ